MDDDGDRQSEESEKEFRIDKTHWSKDTESKFLGNTQTEQCEVKFYRI